jgi:WD40 repeat protein
MPRRLRIFVSSPGDVPNERLRASLIVDKLSQEYGRFFTIETYRWEHEAMLASKHFQDAIEPPSAFDIVVLILWSRLGTPLPVRTADREYHGIDGRTPVTGTEWEYEEALKVARQKKAPDLLAFRNVSPAPIDPRDPEIQAKSIAQLTALNGFWTRHFADRGVFLAAYDEYHTLEQFAQRLEESLRKLIERRIKDASGRDSRTEPIWLGEPFRGLESYEFAHAPIFFGRDAAVMKATEQLVANAGAGHAFLLVSGASGSGKSSLVKAGIVPRLIKPQRISGTAFLRRAVFRPSAEDADVILGLANALTRPSENSDVGLPELIGPGQDAGQLATHLRGAVGDPSYPFVHALGHLTETGRASGRLLAFESAKLILVVDQLEELFTSPGIGPEDRRLFIKLLVGLARSGAVWVIATLRADFWHRGAEVSELVSLAEGQGRIDLAAASPAELAEMIRKPAHAAGLSFEVHPEKGLGLDAVLAEHAAAAPGALPLLSFTLDELYKNAKARGEAVLTHASYEALGGLEGAIAKRADDIVAGLPAAAQVALPQVLRALTTVTGPADQVPVGRSAPLESFADGSPARILVDAFIAARLLVAASEGGAPPTVRLAHEALISRWQRARDQLAADRRDLETRTLVERQFGRWNQARGRARGLLLLRNPDLANAVDLAKRWGDELNAPTRNFIKLSRQRAQVGRTLTAVAAILFAATAAFSGVQYFAAEQAKQEAVRQRDRATAQESQAIQERTRAEAQRNQALVTQSRFLTDLADQRMKQGDAGSALLLEIEALPDSQAGVERPYVPQAELGLFGSYLGLRETAILRGHNSKVLSAAFSPDGKYVVTASSDATARLWDTAGRQIAVLEGHGGPVLSAVYSPDGRRVLTASADNTARIWDAATGNQIAALAGHTAEVTGAAFISEGRRVLTRSYDNTARMWDADTGKQIVLFAGHTEEVTGVVVSSDERRVLTISHDHTARIWDTKTGKQTAILKGGNGELLGAGFDDDDALVAMNTIRPPDYDEKTVEVWNVQTGKQIARLKGHDVAATSAVFSPDGHSLATASDDKTARLWYTAPVWQEGAVFKGHEQVLKSVAFSSDSERVLTTDAEAARVWDAPRRHHLFQLDAVLKGHNDKVTSAAFSPDGNRVVTTSDDHTARLWRVVASDAKAAEYPSNVNRIAASCLGRSRRVLAIAADDEMSVWDAETRKQIAVIPGHAKGIPVAAFSRDCRRVVTAADDNTVRTWDTNTGKQIAIFGGHTNKVTSAAFDPDGGRVVTASEDKTARIWDAETGKQFSVLLGNTKKVTSAEFDPDGKRVVTGSEDNTVRIWDAETGKQAAVLAGHTGEVMRATFSPDGRLVASASVDKTARIWNSETGELIAVLTGHAEVVSSVTFSPDSGRVVTASQDKSLRIWDVKTAQTVAVLDRHDADPSSIFSPDGRFVLTRNMWPSGAAGWRVFSVTQDLVDQAKRDVPRCLSSDEREEAFLDATPPDWCVELAKWPYDTVEWKTWLTKKKAGQNPSLPNVSLGDALDWLEIAQRLAKADATNTDFQSDLADAFAKLGDVLKTQGDLAGALKSYRDSLAIAKVLVAKDGNNAQWRNDLQYIIGRVGGMAYSLVLARDFKNALEAADQAISLTPDEIWLYTNKAHALMFLGRVDEARTLYVRYHGEMNVEGKSWDANILEDFAELRKAGLTNPLMDEIEKLFSQ